MLKNNIILGNKIPFLWKKNITFNNLERKNFLTPIVEKNIFLKYILLLFPFIFSYRKNEFLLTDFFIIGDNPFLNILLLKKISDKAVIEKKQIKVTVLNQSEADYWGYHIIKNDNQECLFFNKVLSEINFDYLNLSYIVSSLEYSYNHKFKEGYVVFLDKLNKENYENHFFKNIMPNIFKSISNIKGSFNYLFNSKLKEMCNFNIIYFKKENPIIISKNIFFTTFNKNLNGVLKENICNYFDDNFLISEIEHEFKNFSFGSALHFPNDFLNFNELVCYDLEKLKELDLNNLISREDLE